jgi:hypothetical protein
MSNLSSVWLKDGTEVPGVLFNTTLQHLNVLQATPNVLLELLKKCRNPEYDGLKSDVKEVLRGYNLIDDNANVYSMIQKIVLIAVQMDGEALKVINPIAAGRVTQEDFDFMSLLW